METQALLVELMLDHKNNTADVARALVSRAMRDDELRNKLVELGAHSMVRHYLSDMRTLPKVEMPRVAGNKAKVAFMRRYTLFGGAMLLANATRKDLAISARKHDAQSGGHNAAAAFERAVGAKLPNDAKRVGDVLSDEAIVALYKKTKGGKT